MIHVRRLKSITYFLTGSKGRSAVWTAFVASLATLLCCALPSLLVLLGLGTTVAAAVSAAPWLVALSRHKAWVFAAAGLMIAGSRLYIRYVVPRVGGQGAACWPALNRATRAAWWGSAFLYTASLLVAYVLGPVLDRASP